MGVLGNPTSSGPGVLSFTVESTDGPSRVGTITIAGRVATITQSPGCAYAVNPTALATPAQGGSAAIAVRTAAGCAWTASGGADWISVTSGQSGAGPGEVRLTVLPIPAPPGRRRSRSPIKPSLSHKPPAAPTPSRPQA
jgi:hypothetical protein